MTDKPTPPAPQSESLPSIIPDNLTIPEPILLSFQDTEDDVQKANIELYNTRLKVVHALWSKANSFSKALTLLNEIDKLIQMRANIMGTPYGVTARNLPKGSIVYPAD